SGQGGSLPPEGPAPYREVGERASRGHRAQMPLFVWYRHPGTPELGTGTGRIRDGLADPRWAPDREPDRSADNNRSGTAGRDATALDPYSFSLLYRPSFISLARVPHGEPQHAARDERRVRARLWHPRAYPRPSLSPLQRGVSIRQARV